MVEIRQRYFALVRMLHKALNQGDKPQRATDMRGRTQTCHTTGTELHKHGRSIFATRLAGQTEKVRVNNEFEVLMSIRRQI